MSTEPAIPAHFVRMSQAYLVAWSGIALAASIGAIDHYADGPDSTKALAYIGIGTGGTLLLAILVETYQEKKPNPERGQTKPDPGRLALLADGFLDWMHRNNLPDRGVHVAVQLLSICSVGLAAVNMHNEVWDWQFGLSCSLMGMVFIYNVMYTPSILVSVAMYNQFPEPMRKVLTAQFLSTSYIWKESYIEDRLMPSTA